MIKAPHADRFLRNEIAKIRQLISKNQLDDSYIKALDRLEAISVNIVEQPLCYIHRDYHPWNVLLDKNGKMYVIDLALKQGDYRFDVAWTYMLMTRTDNTPDSEFSVFAEHFLSEYRNLQPDVFVEFEFFKQLANLRWLVNVQPTTNDFMRYFIKIAESVMFDSLGV